MAENSKQGNTINVVTDQFRTPTFVVDVVELLFVITRNKPNGVFNIGGDMISVFDFAIEISKKNYSGRINPVKSEQLKGAELRPKHSCFKSAKVKLDFNLIPKGIETGIKGAIK